jgi:hypothetical protein
VGLVEADCDLFEYSGVSKKVKIVIDEEKIKPAFFVEDLEKAVDELGLVCDKKYCEAHDEYFVGYQDALIDIKNRLRECEKK